MCSTTLHCVNGTEFTAATGGLKPARRVASCDRSVTVGQIRLSLYTVRRRSQRKTLRTPAHCTWGVGVGGGGGMITGANTGVLNVGGGSSGGYDYRCEHRRTEPGRGWELGGGGMITGANTGVLNVGGGRSGGGMITGANTGVLNLGGVGSLGGGGMITGANTGVLNLGGGGSCGGGVMITGANTGVLNV